MARENKFSLSQSRDLQVRERPAETSQVFAHEIARERGAGEGLEGLSQVLGNFFQAASNATQNMRDANTLVERDQIKRENEQQARKGSSDALSGKPVDPALATDYDYTDAHTKTAAILHGDKLATDWEEYARKLPVNSDIASEKERWLKEQIGTGSSDPLFNAHLLSTFKQKSDVVDATFRTNQFKTFQIKAQSDFGAEIAARVATGESTADEFQDWQSRAVPIFQGDVVKARAFVLSQMAAGARTPKALAQVDTLLHAPGYDENGGSFADRFPAAAAQTSDSATDKYLKATEAPGFLALRDAADSLRQAALTGDLASVVDMVKPGGALDQVNSKYGAEPQYQALKNHAFTILEKLAAEQVGLNQYLDVATGKSALVDKSNINKWQLQVLGRSGIDPLRSPQEAGAAAAHVISARGLADTLKATMEVALSDKNNPKAQANAFMFWRGLEAGKFDIDSTMTRSARETYAALKYASVGTSIDSAILKLNENRSQTKLPAKATEFDWPALTNNVGKPSTQVYKEQLDDITNGIAKGFGQTGFFGGGKGTQIAMDDDVRNDVMSIYARSMVTFRDTGNGNYADDAKAYTLRAIQSDYITVPAANGKVRLMRKDALPKQVPVTEVNYETGGKTVSMRDAVGPGVYRSNGVEEDTTVTMKKDMQHLHEAAPFIFKGADDYYTAYNDRLTPMNGRFVVHDAHTNEPVMFQPGQTISIDGVNLKGESQRGIVNIPTDPAQAREFIESRLPPEFKVETSPYGGLVVTYGYRLTGQPTMKDLASQWDDRQRGSIRSSLPTEDAKQAYDARQVWMETTKKSTEGAMKRQPEAEAPLPTDPYWREFESARRRRNKFFQNFGVKE